MRRFALGACPVLLFVAAPTFAVDVKIDAAAARKPISPFVYGANQPTKDLRVTAWRQGGNRLSAYNWENNASSAGSDWQHSSDSYLCNGVAAAECMKRPGWVITQFVEEANARGAYPLVTLQMMGYVARDMNGNVSPAEAAPSSRWVPAKARKGSAFSLAPDVQDGAVYMDELVNFLVKQHGGARAVGGVKGYSLDNEPDLWKSTHPRVHPSACGAKELIDRSVELATAVKAVDADAEVFGYASYGYLGFASLQDAPDWKSVKGSRAWYVEYYLAEMKKASDAAGKRLLDVLDLHYYSEARGGTGANEESRTRIQEGTTENAVARMHATRSLWDPTYDYALDPTVGEASWICHWTADCPLRLVPRVQAMINAQYPGTKLAITEYDFGARDHVSGGIAQADALGIFGREGVYWASRWGDGGGFVDAAFRLFIDYDGKGSRFGDTQLSTTTSDAAKLPAYAAMDAGDPSKLHVVLINRSLEAQTVNVSVVGAGAYKTARAFGFDASGPAVKDRGAVTLTSGGFTYSLPATSAVHVVLSRTADVSNPPPAPGTGGTTGGGEGGTPGTGVGGSGAPGATGGTAGAGPSLPGSAGASSSGDDGSRDSGCSVAGRAAPGFALVSWFLGAALAFRRRRQGRLR
jgi:mannan endo-1,4-beta-mannosidase